MYITFDEYICVMSIYVSVRGIMRIANNGVNSKNVFGYSAVCTVSHRSEYTPHIFVNVLLYLHVTTLKK